jgi:N-acylglucosamine 2-epimerase
VNNSEYFNHNFPKNIKRIILNTFHLLTDQYKNALLEDVIPFWERYSIDYECGGYFTCLDREGSVFDTDKFIWLQARQVWTFASLYNRVEQKQTWLDIAKHGVKFLQKHGMDAEGNWFFSLDRTGNPLVQPYNIFSDCFAAMAFAQYTLASGDGSAAEIAQLTFTNILKREANPKGIFNKSVSNTRPMKNFALPMILSNLILELEPLLSPDIVESSLDRCVHEVMNVFYDPDRRLILESIHTNGNRVDCFEGRLINPGHSIEALGFILDICKRRNNLALAQKVVRVLLSTLEFGWDETYGGIFYFLDISGHPPQQLEWDQKLWWVHMESLVTLALASSFPGNDDCLHWFHRIHEYTWEKFPDPEYGEWYGYLNRRGEPLLSLKGGKWKGCFHVPRGLMRCWQILAQMADSKTPEIS